jgi:hypothetical protein
MTMTFHPLLVQFFISITEMKLFSDTLVCDRFFVEFELRRETRRPTQISLWKNESISDSDKTIGYN